MTVLHRFTSLLLVTASLISVSVVPAVVAAKRHEATAGDMFGIEKPRRARGRSTTPTTTTFTRHRQHHHQQRSSLHFRQATTTTTTTSVAKVSAALINTIPRGGDLGPVKGETLATILCGFGFLDAISGLLAPYTSLKWLGLTLPDSSSSSSSSGSIDDEGKSLYTKLSHHYMHGIGISSLCFVVSLMLTVHDVVPLQAALGYTLLIRLLSTIFLLISGECYELGMTENVFVVLAFLLGITTFHLLGGTGFGDVFGQVLGSFGGDQAAMNMVKIVSYLLAVHGYFLFSAPKLFVQRAVNRKKKQESTTNSSNNKNKKKGTVVDTASEGKKL
jgi:hypothetical protein